MKHIVALASGRGSNFQAIIDALEEGYIPAECVCLITDNRHAYAIDRATQAGIPVRILAYESFSGRQEYDRALQEAMGECKADLFILCGYMRLLDPATVRTFHYRIINIHPALLPSFPGLHAQRQALEYGVQVTGCTVHFVDEGMDTGPIILQRCVPVFPEDDEDSLSLRILEQEHEILVEATKLFCEDRLQIEGRRVYHSGEY
ncbi:MAG: phosphoribosylglycinamide formyltransferase [Methanomicrobiales archaeon]|nr:phosphoribosylglycinamide formyltransferase [Methanomicrobiales archaeon]